MSGSDGMRVGEMLIKAGLITETDLDGALQQQKKSGGRLVNVLISQGALDSKEFVKFLSEDEGYKAVDLSHFDIEPEVIALVPKEFALANEVVPVDRIGKTLTLAMMCPLDEDAIKSLEEHTAMRVKPVICSAEDVRACLKRHYEAGPDTTPSPKGIAGPLKLTTAVTMLRHIDGLPALPGTVQRVREMIYEEEGSSAEVGQVVSRDPAIAAKVLKVANSAAYGLPQRVDNVQLAVSLLGLLETYSVVISSAVINIFDRSKVFDYMTFWLESMVCATFATALAKAFDPVNRTGIFSAGLLHDIGRVALAEVAPKHYAKVKKGLMGLDLLKAEEELLGLAHTEAGYYLAGHWDLPEAIAEAIRYHHAPNLASDNARPLVALVNIADVVSRAHRPDSETRTPDFEECAESLALLKINEEQVLEVFASVTAPEPADSLWSPN